MRRLMILAVLASLAAPAAALADWSPAKQRWKGPKRAAPASALHVPDGRSILTAAPPRAAYVRPAPRVPWATSAFVLGVDSTPFWLGRSWGWGYYPLWPSPAYEGARPGYLPDARRPVARLEAYGAGGTDALAGTLALSMEGPIAGFSAEVTGLALPDPAGVAATSTLTLASARAAWSIASEAAFRLRLELGGAMLSVPSGGMWSGTSFASTVAFGPQIGLSGHLGLVGPIGLEGHARVAPWPTPVVDAKAAVVLRGGPLAFSAGWRSVDVNGDGLDAPEAHFKGPEVGLQLMF